MKDLKQENESLKLDLKAKKSRNKKSGKKNCDVTNDNVYALEKPLLSVKH